MVTNSGPKDWPHSHQEPKFHGQIGLLKTGAPAFSPMMQTLLNPRHLKYNRKWFCAHIPEMQVPQTTNRNQTNLQIKSQEDVNLPFERQHWQPLKREEQPPKNNETPREKNAAVTPLYSRHTNSQHLFWTATKTRHSLQNTHTHNMKSNKNAFSTSQKKKKKKKKKK
jgi:hypothetical protein